MSKITTPVLLCPMVQEQEEKSSGVGVKSQKARRRLNAQRRAKRR